MMIVQGSYALTSIMVAAYLDSTVPLPLVTEHSNSSNITMLLEEVNRERILHANAITFFASIFLVRYYSFCKKVLCLM